MHELMDPADILPDTVLNKILNHLPHSPNYAKLACLSKKWRKLTSDAIRSRITISRLGLSKHQLAWHPLDMKTIINGRTGVAAAVNGHTVYFFGGRRNHETALNDLFSCDLVTLEWNRITTNGYRPSPRSHSIMGFIGDDLYLYGGHKVSILDFGNVLPPNSSIMRLVNMNDLYHFSREDNTWTLLRRDIKGPRTRGFYNGIFLPAVPAEASLFPALMVLFEANGDEYRTFTLNLLSDTWNVLPLCPDVPTPPNDSNSNNNGGVSAEVRRALTSRPPMCALNAKDILVVTHHRDPVGPTLWVLSRRGCTSDSSTSPDGWTWTEVHLRSRLNPLGLSPLDQLAFAREAQLICLPLLPDQEWPTVVSLSEIPFSTLRFHLARSMRSAVRRRPTISSPTAAAAFSPVVTANRPPADETPNPLVKVFDTLPDPLQPAGTAGQPLRGVILPSSSAAAAASSSSYSTRQRHHHHHNRNPTSTSSSTPLSPFTPTPTSPDWASRGLIFHQPTPPNNGDTDTQRSADNQPILAAFTLFLSGTPQTSSEHPRLILCEVDAPSEQDYLPTAGIPLGSTYAAAVYSLGSLLVFGAALGVCAAPSLTAGALIREVREPVVWSVAGKKVVCGYDTTETAAAVSGANSQ